MKNFEASLIEAMANSSIDQITLNQEEIDIIKQALYICEQTGKSFFTSLYELTEQLKNEEKRNKSR